MDRINILFVDDESFTLAALERLLRKERYVRHYAENGEKALKTMATTPIQILVTDMAMPEMDGLTLIRQVKKRYPDTVRMALSAYTMAAQLLPCINTGEIFRYITKPVVPEELRLAIEDAIDFYLLHKERMDLVTELKEMNQKLKAAVAYQQKIQKQLELQAITDPLTGLFNRQYLVNTFNQEFDRCQRYEKDMSCLLMDLDHFKQVNDTYGHAAGDSVLREFSRRLQKTIRASDVAFRYGGEEFLVLLPHTDLESANIIAERILHSCRTAPFSVGSRSIIVTASMGAADFRTHGPGTPEQMLKIADEKLYKAKHKGRNQIC